MLTGTGGAVQNSPEGSPSSVVGGGPKRVGSGAVGDKLCPKVILEGTRLTKKTEIAFALKMGKTVIGLRTWDIPGIIKAETPGEAMEVALERLSGK